ncbi:MULTISPECIES: hypothetical protein [Methylobacterium]|uniref:Uncharacterized protein n=1 Tax=Methylobacterium thuringiense TaxID=1003091 RepID=A0ABQ4TPZ2_9HYPH|nr:MULTISPECIES: hypothetical protein [Methylobacterium]TXN22512.1 hypothetical protein FV217_10475 [Methylobacterium sp. WL9]GJE56197.1 hypothetical protein EKPJFOCH_2696 [Methylobacterium thuringiense]
MDRERDRDAATSLIEEHDEKVGRDTPDRDRPGQGDPSSKPVDSQKPPPKTDKTSEEDEAPRSSDPSPFAPR